MRKENKGRLTGGVDPQGNMEGNAHKDPKSALENNAKKQYKTLEGSADLSGVQLFEHSFNSFYLMASEH